MRLSLLSSALGCLCLASLCTKGAHGNLDVFTPETVEAEIGKTALIECRFSVPENANYTYVHWHAMEKHSRKLIISMIQNVEQNKDPKYKDRLSILSNFSLKISDVHLKDGKVYVCQVGLGSLGAGENRTELRVSKAPEPPVIQKTDGGIMASDSENHEIAKCISRNGFPASTVTWYKDDELLTKNGQDIDIRLALTKDSNGLVTVQSTLLAQVTKEDRSALFHCQVDYSLAGTNKTFKSESFQINIHYPSENVSLVMETRSPVVKEGDNVTLRCEADGNPAPEYTFSRFKDGYEEDLSDVLGGKLSFLDISRNESGTYMCKTFDLQTFQELNATVNLFVNYLDVPTIAAATLKQRKHQWEWDPSKLKHLSEGDGVLLTCSASGSKPVEFQWEKKGELISKGNQLNLTSVTYMATGDYICRAAMPDIPGLSRSKSIALAVQAIPQLTPQKDLLQVKEGELLNLTCSAFSVLKPKISWSMKNVSSHMHSRAHQHTSTLSVHVTKALLESGINCSAENRIGRAEHQFRLELRPDVVKPDDNKTGNGTSEWDEEGTTANSPKTGSTKQESRGVIIVAVVVGIMAISILGAVLYFLHKKGKLRCGRSGKQEITSPDAHKDEIVVEVKSDKLPEEAGLLQGANGEKRSASDQGEKYIDLRN
ncbi:cell surface glycoprotein MUC18 isoform X2 [Anolis carolinensis]|uniref:cell surface glycoprotein MUC18 isoform X2 n=1 Tax=Anolis carolinensis TaxID=28377 RepID=UPI000462C0B4|nr:PREDICTED: cell surface glycoprotein MUC18 [Anolis carolinensis]|eukprot:XP_008121225.1 PREDICTED: cell surface glycoprotein MUC18 [Anolis carolinensis]